MKGSICYASDGANTAAALAINPASVHSSQAVGSPSTFFNPFRAIWPRVHRETTTQIDR